MKKNVNEILKENMVADKPAIITLTNVFVDRNNLIRVSKSIKDTLQATKGILSLNDTILIVENSNHFSEPTYFKTLIEQFGGKVEQVSPRSFIATWKEYSFAYVETIYGAGYPHEYRGIAAKVSKDKLKSSLLNYGEDGDLGDAVAREYPFPVWSAEYSFFISEFLNLVLGNESYFQPKK